jgi:hypothetical protein
MGRMTASLPSHPQRVDAPPRGVPVDPARERAGRRAALLGHLGPSGLMLPLLVVVSYAVTGGSDGLVEGGTFLVLFLLIAVAGLQGSLALGCLIGAAVVASRDPGRARGLVTGWAIGAVVVGVSGCLLGLLWRFLASLAG